MSANLRKDMHSIIYEYIAMTLRRDKVCLEGLTNVMCWLLKQKMSKEYSLIDWSSLFMIKSHFFENQNYLKIFLLFLLF